MKPSVSWKSLLAAVTLILFLKGLGALVIAGGSDGIVPERLGIFVFLSLFVLSGILILSSAAVLLFWTLGYLFGAERELHSGRWARLSDEPKYIRIVLPPAALGLALFMIVATVFDIFSMLRLIAAVI